MTKEIYARVTIDTETIDKKFKAVLEAKEAFYRAAYELERALSGNGAEVALGAARDVQKEEPSEEAARLKKKILREAIGMCKAGKNYCRDTLSNLAGEERQALEAVLSEFDCSLQSYEQQLQALQ